TYVLDDFSNAELVAPHCFKPANAEDRKKEKWVSAWAKSLNASSLKPYVRLASKGNVSEAVAADAVQASIWQVGAPLRVCTTEPSEINTTPIRNNVNGIASESSEAIRVSVPLAAKVRASFVISEDITDEEHTAFQVIEELRKYKNYTTSVPAQKLITSSVARYFNISDTLNINAMYNHECAAILESALFSRRNRIAEKANIPEIIKFSIAPHKDENTSTAPDTTSPYYTPHPPTTVETLIEQKILTHSDILFLDTLNFSEKFYLSILVKNRPKTLFIEPPPPSQRMSMLEYIYSRVSSKYLVPDYIFPAIFRHLERIKKSSNVWIDHQLLSDINDNSAYLTSTEFKIDHPTSSASCITYSRNNATTTLALRLSPSARASGVRILSSIPDREPSNPDTHYEIS
nr:hypothetical protein [Tanacetum cinerariifolium]